MPRQPDTANRIVEEAFRLFASRGYERTTVAQIEEKAGLTPGAGGMYAHFPSKEAVLRAGIERYVTSPDRLHAVADLFPLGDMRAEMVLAARAVLAELATQADALRVGLRGLDNFPELYERVRDARVHRNYELLASVLERYQDEGLLRPHNARAMAAVLLGCLVNYRTTEAVWGQPPAMVSEDAIVDAVVELGMSLAVDKAES